MLADKARLGVCLGVIDLFPRALDKRPGAGFADDCWHAGIVAIIRFFHFGGRRLGESPNVRHGGEKFELDRSPLCKTIVPKQATIRVVWLREHV